MDGVLPTLRRRLFGERDAVAVQLADIARQGSGMARVAHLCALLLVVLFSAGSLVALSGDALAAALASWQRGRLDIPDAISVAVSTLLVLCMDVGMLYAASMLRVLNARRAEGKEKRLHQLVMTVVAILEAATYAYMAARYEDPTGAVIWALVAARAGAAPLLAIYLSMARPLPVGPRDILYQVELATGRGVIADAVTVANDPAAPLERKMALFGASAVMTDRDRERLAHMIAVMERPLVPTMSAVALSEPSTTASQPPSELDAVQYEAHSPDDPPNSVPPSPPTGPATPSRKRSERGVRTPNIDEPGIVQLAVPAGWEKLATHGRSGRANRRQVRTPSSTATVEAKVRSVWKPGMTVSMLERAAGISRSAAGKWRRVLKTEEEVAAARNARVAQ